jgi:anti-sigma B factor antagonist
MEIHELPSGTDGVTVLALDGGLDHTTTDVFVTKMEELLQQGTPRVVLDLKKLTYTSSWGLAAMVRVHHHYAMRGGRIAFADLHTAVAKILHISRLEKFFDLYPTVPEAVRGIAPKPENAG